MCHKPKAQLLADAPDTKEWRLRAKSCQAEDYAVVARGGTLQVIVCSGECRDACADILYDFQLQKAPCGSMELANTTAETHFDLEFERAIVESQKSPDHSAWASLWRAADTASGVADLIPTAWPSTNEVQREDKFHITDLALEQEESIDFQEALQKVRAAPSSPDGGRNLPAYVFKGHVSSEGDLTPPSLSGASSQESMGEQDETEAAEAQAEEGDDSPAASGAPSASTSCAPSFVSRLYFILEEGARGFLRHH